MGPGSSDRQGVNRSLPALHCRPFLISIILDSLYTLNPGAIS